MDIYADTTARMWKSWTFSKLKYLYREIATCLSAYQPLIKVMQFVGHGGSGGGGSGGAPGAAATEDEDPSKRKKSRRGLTQKEQVAIVKKFRDGGYNTLVATCVGEEGLDIGEVLSRTLSRGECHFS